VHDQRPAQQFRQIAQAAPTHRVPSNYAIREYAKAGGLLSYDADLIDNFRRAATYVDKILRPSGGGPLVDSCGGVAPVRAMAAIIGLVSRRLGCDRLSDALYRVLTTSAGQARASTRACHSLILPSRSITTPTRAAPFSGSGLAP